MKLRNKKTGEIKECVVIPVDSNGYPNEYQVFEKGDSLAELNEDWEDYEGQKEYWAINEFGTLVQITHSRENIYDKSRRNFGNYFETKEEAELAVRKLKAWKRLKDKGFRFDGWKCTGSISFTFDNYYGDGQPRSASDDLDLLFCTEENS